MSSEIADRVVERLAEHRLDWERIERQITSAASAHPAETVPDGRLGPYVTVARQSGAGGGTFARRLGEALGWTVLDSEIVDLIADTFQLDGAMLHLLDESRANWVRDVLGDLMPHQVINLDTYVHHLGKIMRLVALHGEVVLVGRGAQLFLPRERGLALRLVAFDDDRISRISARDGVERAAAHKHMDDVDRRRAHFLEHYFGRDVNDPTLYDLVLNRSTLGDDELLDIALATCRHRGYDN